MTPIGVRDGDPEALAGLCDVRGPAVLAYCEVVAGRDRAAAAAAEAFGSFRAGVVVAGDLATINPEALLVSATRHAAARHATGDVPAACARVPQLLAARADRSITLADHDWLEEHLASCWTCRAPVARFNVADKAYADPPREALAADVKAAMVAAMTAAAPTRRQEPAAPPPSTNGSAPHVGPLPEEPAADYEVPALDTPAGELTSAYEIPVEELGMAEDPARERRRRDAGDRPARAVSRLRAKARGARPARRAAGSGAGAATAAEAFSGTPAGHDVTPSPAPYDSAAADLGAAPPSPASHGVAASQAGTYDAATTPGHAALDRPRGAAMPRPRRELTRRPARRRRRGALRPAVVLPIVLLVIAIVAALAIAGVLGGGEPASVPQSFAPDSSAPPARTSAAPVVVVPGAGTAGAAAVERAKARARARAAAKRKAAAAKRDGASAAAPPAAAADTPPPAAAPPPAPPPPPPSSSGRPKIDAGNGATGAEQLPSSKDTSTVPELAPPVEPAAPPPG